MNRFFLIILFTLSLFATNLEELQKEKVLYKKEHKKIMLKKEKIDKVIIIFKKSYKKSFLEKYNLKLQNCVTPNICIFKVLKNSNLSQIKKEPPVKKLVNYKKHHFKEY